MKPTAYMVFVLKNVSNKIFPSYKGYYDARPLENKLPNKDCLVIHGFKIKNKKEKKLHGILQIFFYGVSCWKILFCVSLEVQSHLFKVNN